MDQTDEKQLTSKHFNELLDYSRIWKDLMGFYGVSRSIDLTYLYNRDCMPDILQHHRVLSSYDQWLEVLDLKSSGLAYYLCHQHIPPRNMLVFLQKAIDQACHWVVYLVFTHFKPRVAHLYIDTCFTYHKPHELPEFYHHQWLTVLSLKKPKELLDHLAYQSLTLQHWQYVIPRFFHVDSIDRWNQLLEDMHDHWRTLDVWKLLWDTRDKSVYPNEMTIMLTLKYLGNYVDFCIELIQTLRYLEGFGPTLVNASFHSNVDIRLRDWIHELWPRTLPSIQDWNCAVKRGDIHAISLIKKMTNDSCYWNLDTLILITQSRHVQLKQIIQELLEFKPDFLQVMCDVKFGRAIIFSKDDEFCYMILKSTNFACYEVTEGNHRLLIQFKMIKSLLYLHIMNVQVLNSMSLDIAVIEQFMDLITVLVTHNPPIVSFQEELWSRLLLRILVTNIKEKIGRDMATILLSSIPKDHKPSTSFNTHVNLIKQKL